MTAEERKEEDRQDRIQSAHEFVEMMPHTFACQATNYLTYRAHECVCGHDLVRDFIIQHYRGKV